MQKSRPVFFTLSLVYFVLLPFFTEAQRFNFHNLNVDLPSECYCVLQDSKGYMWFSSEQGLYRYNGNALKCFNITNGLPDNNVFQLFEDSHGRILFSTLVGKIGYIEHDSVIFPQLNKKLEVMLGYGNRLVMDIYVDKSQILWISSYVGLLKTPKPNDYSDIELAESPCDSCNAGNLIIDDKKALTYMSYPKYPVKAEMAFFSSPGKNTHIMKYDADGGRITLRQTILLNNGNILWGLGQELYIIKPDGSFVTKKFNKKLLCLYQDKTGGVWIGLRNIGLLYYKDASLNDRPVQSLQGYSVSSIMMDAEDGVWASTLEKGIFYSNSVSVIDYTNCPGLDKRITAISFMGNKILASSSGSTLNVIGDTGVLGIDFPTKFITEATYDHLSYNNKLYIATPAYLMRVDSNFRNWTMICQKKYQHFEVFSPSMQDIEKSQNSGLYTLNGSNFYKLEGDSISLVDKAPGRCKTICITRNGEIYVGCANGLYRYADKKYTSMAYMDKALNSKIYKIKEAPDSSLWILIPTTGVLICRKDKVIATISTKNGLSTNNTYDVAFDQKGNGWVGTEKGISEICPSKNYSVENFAIRHGIVSGEVLRTAIKDDKLWLGAANGLCVVDIATISRNKVAPKVYISSVRVNDSLIAHEVNFKHGRNNFRFAIDGLTYKDNTTRFVYRLTGLDTSWHSSNSAEISFNGLPPGSYNFEVKAVNADDIASLVPAVFSFAIEKPFWLKWWFIVLEIFSGGVITYVFIQARLRTIRNKEEEKTRINKVIAEYEITALRTQMNPHFIFNAINSIQHYVLQNNSHEAYNYLAKFSRLIRLMLNNAQEKKLTLQQELEMLQLYISLEQLRFSQSFSFVLTIDETIDTQQVQLPAMLIQPYVENAIWHGLMNLKDKSDAEISITITQEETQLRIVIKDNGIGREQAKALQKDSTHRSVGMELTRKRMEVLNKVPGEEKVEIEVIDMYDEQKIACGTKVQIVISDN